MILPYIFENIKYALENLGAKRSLKLRENEENTDMCVRRSLQDLQEVCLEERAVLGSFPGVTYVKEDDPICNVLPWTYFLFYAVSTGCYNSSFVFFHSGKRVRIQVNRLSIASPRGWEPGQDHLDLEEGRTLVSASAALGNRSPAIVTRPSFPTGLFHWSLGLSNRKRPPVILNGLTKELLYD